MSQSQVGRASTKSGHVRLARIAIRSCCKAMPHAAEVHRFDMHAPERLKSHRRGIRACTVTIARRPPPSLRLRLLVVPFLHLRGQIPQMFCVFAQIFRAQQMARPPHQTCRRKIVFPAVVLRFQRASMPGRDMVRPGRGCRPLSRNDEAPSEILHSGSQRRPAAPLKASLIASHASA
jgi:hypothetical protein